MKKNRKSIIVLAFIVLTALMLCVVLSSCEEIAEYTVTFDTQGGSTINVQTVKDGYAVSEPSAPIKEGYTFDGWWIDKNYSTRWSFGANVVRQNLTLYAKWTLEQHTVTFDSDGGTEIAPFKASVETNYLVSKPQDPEKYGYVFEGWFNGDAQWDFENDTVGENVSLTAKWKLGIFTIEFNSLGGGNISSITAAYNSELIEPKEPQKHDYTFMGWFDKTGKEFDFSKDTMPGENITLTAKWRADSYGICNFYLNGSIYSTATISIETGYMIAKPLPPEIKGQEFIGWFTEEDGRGEEWNFNTSFSQKNQNIKLYAYFEAKYIILTYDWDIPGVPSVTRSGDYNDIIPQRPEETDKKTKNGYTFEGWLVKDTREPFTKISFPEESLQLIANWVPIKHFVQFVYDATWRETSFTTIENGYRISKPADPSLEGYTFMGWGTSNGEEWNFETGIHDGASTLILWAKWDPKKYQLMLDYNQSYVNPSYADTIDPKLMNMGAAIPEPSVTIAGYRFDGWYEDKACTKKYNLSSMPSSSLTLYAKWEKI